MLGRLPRALPKSQLLAACIFVLANAVAFSISPSLLGGSVVLAAVLFSWLLIRGSRVGWTVVLFGAIASLTGSRSEFLVAVVGVLTSICLLAPSSMKYTWKVSTPGGNADAAIAMRISLLVERSRAAAYRVLAQAAGWADSDLDEDFRRTYTLLAWRLGWLAILLLIPLTLTYRWDQASHSAVANGLAKAIWMGWALVVVAFAVTLLILAWQGARELSRHGNETKG